MGESMQRTDYYDRLVKQIVLYGAGIFIAVGSFISYLWIEG